MGTRFHPSTGYFNNNVNARAREKVASKKTYTRIAFVHREELMLHQITDGEHFMQLIYGTRKTLLDCEYVTEPEAATDFVREFWKEEQGKNHTVGLLSKKYASMVNFQHLKKACHKNHKKTRRRLANEYQQQHEQNTSTEVVGNRSV